MGDSSSTAPPRTLAERIGWRAPPMDHLRYEAHQPLNHEDKVFDMKKLEKTERRLSRVYARASAINDKFEFTQDELVRSKRRMSLGTRRKVNEANETVNAQSPETPRISKTLLELSVECPTPKKVRKSTPDSRPPTCRIVLMNNDEDNTEKVPTRRMTLARRKSACDY